MKTPANKKELARILDCSLPTLDRLIDRYDDFPVQQRGTNGREWVFIVEDVKAYVEAKRTEEEAALTERFDLLRDLQVDAPDGDGQNKITPNQELALVRAERERRALRRDAGMLVDTATMHQKLAPVMAALGQFMQGIPGRMGRRFNLPSEVVDAMGDEIADELRRQVSKMKADLGYAASDEKDEAVGGGG